MSEFVAMMKLSLSGSLVESFFLILASVPSCMILLTVTFPFTDPYLNTDAGTMSPFEHGEVFVLDDGGEVCHIVIFLVLKLMHLCI